MTVRHTPHQGHALSLILEEGPLDAATLGYWMLTDPRDASRTLRRMERNGQLEKRREGRHMLYSVAVDSVCWPINRDRCNTRAYGVGRASRWWGFNRCATELPEGYLIETHPGSDTEPPQYLAGWAEPSPTVEAARLYPTRHAAAAGLSRVRRRMVLPLATVRTVDEVEAARRVAGGAA